MLNEFAFEFLRFLKSLLAVTKRHARLATNFSQVFDNCLSPYVAHNGCAMMTANWSPLWSFPRNVFWEDVTIFFNRCLLAEEKNWHKFISLSIFLAKLWALTIQQLWVSGYYVQPTIYIFSFFFFLLMLANWNVAIYGVQDFQYLKSTIKTRRMYKL